MSGRATLGIRGRMRRVLALVVALLASTAFGAPPSFVDYLYIEANEGGSSGGHVAVRFGDETYHFQHEPPGVLRLRRDDSAEFRHRYGAIENRTIHASRVAVTGDAYRRLRNAFNDRYHRERKLFAFADALRDDETVLAMLRARRGGDATASIALRGAGYFLPADASAAASAALRALRDRIDATYGRDARRARVARLRRALAGLAPPAAPMLVDVPAEGYPSFAPTYSERYRDLAAEVVALDVLAGALPLRPDARRAPPDDAFALDDVERAALAAFADRLADELVRLAGAERPGTGVALLVGMARLEALDESVRSGRLVLLDVFPPEAVVAPAPRRRHEEALRGLRDEARADLGRVRARLDARLGDADFARLEAAGNRVAELDAALADGADLRVTDAPLAPSREGPWPDVVDPDAGVDDLERALAAARETRRRFVAALEARFAYDLVAHNCVSELFRTIDAAGVDLGGRVGGGWSLDFVPFVAARSVDATWDVVERTTQPSHRRLRLAAVTEAGGWPARLRESNVVTSTIYRWNDEDSAFLFFTDDGVATRPLFGAINVAVGVGAGVAGLAALPFDDGRLLGAGLRGVLYSVPELAFVNLRKGSFDYVPRDEDADAAAGRGPG